MRTMVNNDDGGARRSEKKTERERESERVVGRRGYRIIANRRNEY